MADLGTKMAEAALFTLTMTNILVTVTTRYKNIREFLEGHLRNEMPVALNDPDNRPPAVVINMSRNARPDVNVSGYCVIAAIGVVKTLSSAEITRWAEGAASVIARLNKVIGKTPLTLVFACPVAVAFIVGTLLGHSREYNTLHWTGTDYVPLDSPNMDRFRRGL